MTMQLCVSVIPLAAMFIGIFGSDNEMRLTSRLFDNYNPLIRPATTVNHKIVVSFGVALIQVINVDERNQVMKTNMWLRMQWNDYQLRWDEKEYGGIQLIRVEANRLWQPDIVLFNNADGKYEISYKCRILVYHTGVIEWIPPTIYKSSCTIDVKYFPFDQQVCELKFGSWTFNAKEVGMSWYSGPWIDLRDYIHSGTWDVVDVPGEIIKTNATKAKPSQEIIKFNVILRRKTLFYTVNLLTPCVLTSFLSMLVFYLPAVACEKITLSISILLALTVFLLLLQKQLPPSAVLPLLAKYLLFTFVLNIFSIVLTVVITNWSFRTSRTHHMSRWVKVLLLGYLPRILFMKRPNHERWKNSLESDKESVAPLLAQNYHDRISETHSQNCNLRKDIYKSMNHSAEKLNVNSPEVRKSAAAVNFIANHLKEADMAECVMEDWIYAGLVLDRLMLVLFVTVTVGGSLKIIFDNPHIFQTIDQEGVVDRYNHLNAEWASGNVTA